MPGSLPETKAPNSHPDDENPAPTMTCLKSIAAHEPAGFPGGPLIERIPRRLVGVAVLVAAMAAPSCSTRSEEPKTAFLLGADISALASRPALAGKFNEHGEPGSEIAIMERHGWNTFRLRIFVDPVRKAPLNSLASTIPVAKQIKDSGALFLLDIHYSDTWADPQHQETPLAWRSLGVGELEKKVEDYTADVIGQLRAAGAMPDMVQVGNEITGGMLWPLGHVRVPASTVKLDAGPIQALPEPYDDDAQWDNFTRFIKAGIRGVRKASGDHAPKIVIHIDCGGDWPVTRWFFDHLAIARVDYDIIGQSFYPFYHGTPDDLQGNLIQCARSYHKPFLVAETGYAQNGGDDVMKARKYNLWPGTPQGQLQFMADVINTVKRAPGGMGVYYWAPEGRTLGEGNSLWTKEGGPEPAISVLQRLSALTAAGASHLPLESQDSSAAK
jgi:arabinogalactan endo-1,4-beta-galactosidase